MAAVEPLPHRAWPSRCACTWRRLEYILKALEANFLGVKVVVVESLPIA